VHCDACNATGATWPFAGLVAIAAVRLARRRHIALNRSVCAAAKTLQEGIADFYDASTGVWVEIWGEHLHHGFYPQGFKGTLADHRLAQVTMIEEVLRWAAIPPAGTPGAPLTVLDVGCGVGGSARYLQRKFGGAATGITLSRKQREQAQALSEAAGQGETCSFLVADALHMPFPDNSFDLVWSLESGEHMPDKNQFMREMCRVCKPGGRLILVTWVHRDLAEDEDALKPRETRLLDRISRAYHLPKWFSMAGYRRIAGDLSFSGIRTADWTKHIMPFWGGVIRSAIRPKGWLALLRGGWQTLRGALVMPLMARGYRTGTIKFGLLTGTKADAVQGDAIEEATPIAAALFSRRTRLLRSPGCRASAANDVLKTTVAIWAFTRPHTLFGTLISVPMVHVFAASPHLVSLGFAAIAPKLSASIALALVPALLINVYITGLNQIYDVEIDKVNKPYLPIPAGRLSLSVAWRICVGALMLAVAWSWAFLGARSLPLHITLASSAVLGTAYSMPPFRLKRFPLLAAFCIIVVRGLVVNLGFYCFALESLDCSVGMFFDVRGNVAAGFFAIFGSVIALMKDVPDIAGDEKNNIRSLSVRLGPNRVLQAATTVLWGLLGVTASLFAFGACRSLICRSWLLAALRAVMSLASMWALRFTATRSQRVDPRDPQAVYKFYMDVWVVFYMAYLCLPLSL